MNSSTTGRKMRRILFIGPTGVGKSTLINTLINDNVTAESMSSPAGAGDTSHGQTSFFVTYYDFPNISYTDSIGLGDNRFQPEDVMLTLKSIIKNSMVGYNKIYLCIQYGRISSDIRGYIDLITTIFGESVLQWCSIIFTRCNDRTMTKELYLRKNKEDANIVGTIDKVQTVLFGDNMIDDDADVEAILRKRRQEFLVRIKQDIDETAKSEYFQVKTDNLLERIFKIFQIIFGTYGKLHSVASEVRNVARAVVDSMHSSRFANFFGTCSICTEDVTDENQPVITKCNHVYHKKCIDQWIEKNNVKSCPICRAEFNNPENKFYSDLTVNN